MEQKFYIVKSKEGNFLPDSLSDSSANARMYGTECTDYHTWREAFKNGYRCVEVNICIKKEATK